MTDSFGKEFTVLKRFLITTYYQTVWEDFGSHEDIWNTYIHRTCQEHLQNLVAQIDMVLEWSPWQVFGFLDKDVQPDGLYFDTAQEAVEWLRYCRSYMQTARGTS